MVTTTGVVGAAEGGVMVTTTGVVGAEVGGVMVTTTGVKGAGAGSDAVVLTGEGAGEDVTVASGVGTGADKGEPPALPGPVSPPPQPTTATATNKPWIQGALTRILTTFIE
jgi:hypothetical protein